MEYVYANTGNCFVTWGPTGTTVHLNLGDTWFADDPFVVARPDLFSSTPLIVHSTTGRDAPEPTPLGAPKRRGRARV